MSVVFPLTLLPFQDTFSIIAALAPALAPDAPSLAPLMAFLYPYVPFPVPRPAPASARLSGDDGLVAVVRASVGVSGGGERSVSRLRALGLGGPLARYRSIHLPNGGIIHGTLDTLLSPTHPVRKLWAYFCSLPLDSLERDIHNDDAGAPCFPRLRMLALWTYAHLDQVHGARTLRKRCKQVLEYRWLCNDDPPSKSLLNDFRARFKDCFKILTAFQSASLACDPEFGKVVAIDGTIFAAAGSKHAVRKTEQLPAACEKIKKELEASPSVITDERRALLTARLATRERALKYALEHDLKQVCLTEPTAHIMPLKEGGTAPARNTQWGPEATKGFIKLNTVINSPSDGGRLKTDVEQMEETHPSPPPKIVTGDAGFHDAADIAALQSKGITTVVAERGERKAPGIASQFQAKHFVYNKDRDAYICPERHELNRKEKKDAEHIRYYGAPCHECEKKKSCCENGVAGIKGRTISRSLHQEAVEKNQTAYQSEVGVIIRKLRSIHAEGVSARAKALMGFRRHMTWGDDHAQSEIDLLTFAMNTAIVSGFWRPLISNITDWIKMHIK